MELKGKNIIVTGGCGFIGSNLVDYLITKEPKRIIVVDNFFLFAHGHDTPVWANPIVMFNVGDAGDRETMTQIFKSFDVDVIFNCAVMPLPHSLEHPVENYNNNVNIVLNLLELLCDGAYKRLIHFSSSEVYGSCKIDPMNEEHPIAPSTVYAASKAAGDLLLQSYVKMADIDARIIRPFNNYGPRQNDETYAAVIPRTIKRLFQGYHAEITGSGEQTRDYVFVEDTARAAVVLAEAEGVTGEIFNIASGKETSVNFIVNKIREIAMTMMPPGMVPQIEYTGARKGDVMRHVGDCTKIQSLGYTPKVDLSHGLQRTVEWFFRKERNAGHSFR